MNRLYFMICALLLAPTLAARPQNTHHRHHHRNHHSHSYELLNDAHQFLNAYQDFKKSAIHYKDLLSLLKSTVNEKKAMVSDYFVNNAQPKIAAAFERVHMFIKGNVPFIRTQTRLIFLIGSFTNPNSTITYTPYARLNTIEQTTQIAEDNASLQAIAINQQLKDHLTAFVHFVIGNHHARSDLQISNLAASNHIATIALNLSNFNQQIQNSARTIEQITQFLEVLKQKVESLEETSKQIQQFATNSGPSNPNQLEQLIKNDFLPTAQWILNPII
ncbi:TPA: hypothetical protein DDZ86_04645 [Candidatus Dependentiae bacterium]|nr:MAG: hypothetical protein UW09_C0002G0160 [candidate division TM6 bacterium GW2011_GWF2_43_87]HBL98902.1 hypothetical protein [Candidatus Dependentiae bacterium]